MLTVVGLLICTATLLGFLGSYWWLLDLAAHFRVQYAIGLSLLTLLCLMTQRWGRAGLFLLGLLPNLLVMVPFYRGGVALPADPGPRLRVLSLNVHSQSQEFDSVRQLIAAYDPDFLLLAETTAAWLTQLATLQGRYPYTLAHPSEDNFGIAFYSKYPLQPARLVTIGRMPAVLAVHVGVTVHTKTFYLIGTHVLPPLGARYARWRDEQLADLAEVAAGVSAPLLVLGDLNATPWSYTFRQLVSRAQLRNASYGYGIQATWPAQVPLLRIPLDHCLHSEGILILNKTIGPYVGSDHYPVLVDFTVR